MNKEHRKSIHLLKQIYQEVYKFCIEEGLVSKLQESLKISEPERFKKLNIPQTGLDILDAVHCVVDKRKVFLFLEEIDKSVSKKMSVFEAGVGTGLLSFFAAAKGADVSGIELNKKTFLLALKIQKHLISKQLLSKNNPQFIFGNALKFKPKNKFDAIISENIYTGMFYEQQVQIMNHLLPFLKKGGKVIPIGMESFLFLSHSTFPNIPQDKELFIPSSMPKSKITSVMLSKAVQFNHLEFGKYNPKPLFFSKSIKTVKTGSINGLLIYSVISMPSGKKIARFGSQFFNEDIIIAIQPTVKVGKDSKIKIILNYSYGAKLKDANIFIKNE